MRASLSGSEMRSSPFRRAMAILLCVQPVLWMSDITLAQPLQQQNQQGSGLAPQQRDAVPGGPDRATPQEESSPTPPGDTAVSSPVGSGESIKPARPSATLPSPSPLDEPVDPDSYTLAHGDVLELNLWGVQNINLRVTVDVEGRAFVPKVGYFNLQGKTLSEARRSMRDAVSRYYRLNFGVSLAEPRTFLVQVVGGVVHPGSYPARATERVATAVGRAGGFGKNASRRRIEIRRRSGAVILADLLLFDLTGDVKFNPHLLDGDVVRVPFEEIVAVVNGAVNRPGRYELTANKDLAELLDLAGGLAPTVTVLLPIRVVRRASQDREEQKEIAFGPQGRIPALSVENQDNITVPTFRELQRMVTVIGAIAGAIVRQQDQAPASPGATSSSASVAITPEEATATRHLPFVEGDSVRTLLARVGGVGPLADLGGAYILREGRSIPVDLYALMMLRDFKADRPIELGDTLVIPFRRRSILVEGAVFAPGSYPYNPAFGVEQYLALAGGRNRFAQPLSNTRLVTARGEMKEYAPNLTIEPGSSIIVPERNFSRSEMVQILLGVAGIVLSGVAVVIAARR